MTVDDDGPSSLPHPSHTSDACDENQDDSSEYKGFPNSSNDEKTDSKSRRKRTAQVTSRDEADSVQIVTGPSGFRMVFKATAEDVKRITELLVQDRENDRQFQLKKQQTQPGRNPFDLFGEKSLTSTGLVPTAGMQINHNNLNIEECVQPMVCDVPSQNQYNPII